MFFDVKFYSYSKPGRYLVAHFPCVAKGQLDLVFANVNRIDNYDIVIASVVTEREILLKSEEAVEVISEQLP